MGDLQGLLRRKTSLTCEVLSFEGSIYLIRVTEDGRARTLGDRNGAMRFSSAHQAGRFLRDQGYEAPLQMVHSAAHDEIIGRPGLRGDPNASFPVGTED